MGVALGTNSNLEGKGLPDDDNLASVSTTKRTGRAEAKLQVSVLYDRCCPCFKCWLHLKQGQHLSYNTLTCNLASALPVRLVVETEARLSSSGSPFPSRLELVPRATPM